jgi:hypothetical protein
VSTAPQTPALPPPIGPAPSPFWPQHLVDLFLRPTKFFAGELALGRTPYVALVSWMVGMSSVIDRLDMRLAQAQLRNDPEQWRVLEALIGTWPRMWSVVLAGGGVAAILVWWLGGWWCRVRLRWSGAGEVDKLRARLLVVYSSFVFAGPAVLALGVETLQHPNYRAASEAGSPLALLMLVMVLWSQLTIYRGALALFPVSRGRAVLWFVALPTAFYLLVGAGAVLVASKRA